MNSSMDFSTLVFLVMAAFVGWRLYSVLGMRTGQEDEHSTPLRPPYEAQERGQVVPFAAPDQAPSEAQASGHRWTGFNAAITEREKRHEVMNTTFVAIDSAVLVDAHLKEQMIQVTVKFSSKLITVTKDADGKVIEGAADKIVDVTDIWTFERKARSSSPAWHLVATESAHAA